MLQADFRDLEIARLRTANAAMLAALEAVDVLSLVIESAVRNTEMPTNHAKVLAALKANRAAIALARGREGGK